MVVVQIFKLIRRLCFFQVVTERKTCGRGLFVIHFCLFVTFGGDPVMSLALLIRLSFSVHINFKKQISKKKTQNTVEQCFDRRHLTSNCIIIRSILLFSHSI